MRPHFPSGLLVSLALVASLSAGCADPGQTATPAPQGSDGTSNVIDQLPKCDLPKKIDFPKWVPDDLPLPEGTYAYMPLARDYGYYRGLFVMPVLTTQFGPYVLKNWPKAGYQLGRGDAEPGEVENTFVKHPAFGAFKAQDVLCKKPHSFLLLIYTPKRPKGPKITTQPASPLPQGSPAAT